MTLKLILEEEKAIIVTLFLLSLAVRFSILISLRHDPIFLMPVVDSLEYDIWAHKILNGQWLWAQPQYHLPLYPYFLAAIYKIFGYNLTVMALIQYVLGSVCSVIFYLIARKFFSKPAATIGGILMAVYWMIAYTQSFLFCENLAMLFNLLMALTLLYGAERKKTFFFAGLMLGFSVISRPDLFLFLIFILFWIARKSISVSNRLKLYGSFVLGAVILIAPIGIRNYAISREPILLRTQVGVNMYIGNHPKYKGAAGVEIGKDWEDVITLPERTLDREVSEVESDRFFIRETLKTIVNDPLGWASLMGGKLFSLLTGRDFLRTEDVYFYNRYVVHSPIVLFSTPLLFAFCTAGLIMSFKDRSEKFLLAYCLLFSVAFLLFFQAKTRYLVPVIPIFLLFAVYGFETFIEGIIARNHPKALRFALLVFAVHALSLLNPLGILPPTEAEAHYAIAKNFDARQLTESAEKYYGLTLKINPEHVSTYNDLGVLYMNQGRYSQAITNFQAALRYDPNAAKSRLNIVRCLQLMTQAPSQKKEGP